MRSFNTTCSISSMTIAPSNKMVRLLLVPSTYHLIGAKDKWNLKKKWAEYGNYEYNQPEPQNNNLIVWSDSRNNLKGSGLITSDFNALAFFAPFGFPVYGKYADYGNMVVEKDENVKLLEDFFGVSIEKIFDILSSNNSDDKLFEVKNKEILLVLTFCDIKQEVFECLSDENFDENGDWLEKETKRYFETRDRFLNLGDDFFVNEFKRNIVRSFIPTLCDYNFLTLLNIDREFEKKYLEMYTFICNVSKLHKFIFPSCYGSQTPNWHLLLKFNNIVNKILKNNG